MLPCSREHAKRFVPSDGVWMTWWMKYQIFVPIVLLQIVNLCTSLHPYLFATLISLRSSILTTSSTGRLVWYFLILRILYRVLFTRVNAEDDRSDDEDDDNEEDAKKKK